MVRGSSNGVPQPREGAAQASGCSFVLKLTSKVLRVYSINTEVLTCTVSAAARTDDFHHH